MADQWIDPATWFDGVLTEQELNDGLANNMQMLGDPWPAYTVSMTGWTLGNGRLEGWFCELGKTICGRIEYTVGSSDTKSGAPAFTYLLPPAFPVGAPLGIAGLYDLSTGNREFRHVIHMSTANDTMGMVAADDTRLSPTVPWTWATGDQILISYRYEAA